MLRRSAFTSSTTRLHLKPPPVLPAHAPITISVSSMDLEKLGHWSKSVVAKPVVVIIVDT